MPSIRVIASRRQAKDSDPKSAALAQEEKTLTRIIELECTRFKADTSINFLDFLKQIRIDSITI